MNFHKYSKFLNIGSTKTGTNYYDDDSVEYVVTEKAHGTHISFEVTFDNNNGEYNVNVCSRNRVLETSDKFYNHTQVLEKYKDRIINIARILYENENEISNGITLVSIHAELIGGSYPHPDVEQSTDVTIQKGVYYSPEHVVYAYDIYVKYDTDISQNNSQYVNYDKAIEMFEDNDLFYAKILCRGTWDVVCKYPNTFETTIPADLGYPKIENNIAEGVVIKNVCDKRFGNGKRMILKNKTTKFSEVNKRKKIIVDDTPEIAGIKQNILTLINVNRVDAVISKIGEVTKKDFGRIMKDITNDIIEDYAIEYDESYNDLDDKDKKNVRKFISLEARNVINEWFNSV